MKRADSLRILAEWAGRKRSAFKYAPSLASADETAARSHGLAAVRLARLEPAYCPGTVLASLAREEAAFAFRCALNAVGLKTL